MIGVVGPPSVEAGGSSRTNLSKPSISSTSRAFYLLRDLVKTVFGYGDCRVRGTYDENSKETC